MKVEVAFTLAATPADLGPGDAAVVLDVVRATSTIAHALAAGATAVHPLADVEQARAFAAERGALLAGERGGLPPVGFDLGNSPREMTAEAVGQRELVLTTTNGTAAVQRCRSAGLVLAGSLVNSEATARALAERQVERVVLVCAGSGGEVAADDVAGAGCLMGSLALLAAAEPDDAARIAAAFFDTWRHDLVGLLARSLSGRKLAAVGLADDLPVCARVDAVDIAVGLDTAGAFAKLC